MQEVEKNSADEEESFLGISTPALFAVMEVVETCVILLFFAYGFIEAVGFYNNLTNQNLFVDINGVINLFLEFFIEFLRNSSIAR
ncbi:MAG: hypothetical protein A3E21_01635 [Sulfurimonas sp. RIFCSPHIGHO2_12_FULL_36_9]|uniref:hypothetical protein n=1 Tax=Sulfurimonas sp. RIFCSPLOWO2_12_36_12 TaxID=1802253 RepID=UPI0008B70FEB|nr:hypothetical protein [Sulfurimonas sp. RIFCSPLOWO2_12_36_12]OHD97871.1 MAG: hypothetical protein A3E21_01635 [Sulfurimonas sp. RIFCSPHIGHO2_12_FULL_36_9]OHD99259.1 MAG: hypothetical protein A3J26_04495 [Sulfurimonas sp. RIFCSPLOWO2_02_FULL_36_28]OHE03000.1 MAG: hypothetical protein A2W82_01405 [Sulfurimonas sp. RIFCSPLOWO2_12_36_12]